ncbi:hypothetical protein PRUPE_1G116700 [Prunus persica]|uniref:Uncharacterized protein n=1 Tax=Prunus persica TaxID=3760 RepID=A0A251QVZ1_PRUPE|nr:hypothetical protein PRUPE_1G116700 [Prunus persica]
MAACYKEFEEGESKDTKVKNGQFRKPSSRPILTLPLPAFLSHLIHLRLPLTASVSLSRSHPLRLSHDLTISPLSQLVRFQFSFSRNNLTSHLQPPASLSLSQPHLLLRIFICLSMSLSLSHDLTLSVSLTISPLSQLVRFQFSFSCVFYGSREQQLDFGLIDF